MLLGHIFFAKEKVSRPADFRVKRSIFAKRKNYKAILLWAIAVGVALYPIYVYPLYHIEKFRKFFADVFKIVFS